MYEGFSALLEGMKEYRSKLNEESAIEAVAPVIAQIEDITEKCLYTFVSNEGLESASVGSGGNRNSGTTPHYRAKLHEVTWVLEKIVSDFNFGKRCWL